nr:phosphoserine phosphatase SerB [uncultured Sphingorhabdus sp.]
MPILTLIAADLAESGIISEACDRLTSAACTPGNVDWLKADKAVDILFDGDITAARAVMSGLEDRFDIVVQDARDRRKMILVSDMDSTMITVECIDELADFAGIKPQIAAITDRAMAGELDFAEALKARVSLLVGLDEALVQRCLEERVQPMPGAEVLVRTMTHWGAHAVLVSGGFTSFTGPVAQMLGFAEVHANVLEIENGVLTGGLAADIVDAATKRSVLESVVAQRGLSLRSALAVGDGANDLPMIAAAVSGEGLGAAYHPRPMLAEASNFAIRHNDLTALLFAQGVREADWVC